MLEFFFLSCYSHVFSTGTKFVATNLGDASIVLIENVHHDEIAVIEALHPKMNDLKRCQQEM